MKDAVRWLLGLTAAAALAGGAVAAAARPATAAGDVRVGARSAFTIEATARTNTSHERADVVYRRVEGILRTELKPPHGRGAAEKVKSLSEHRVLLLILQVAILLIVARACGEIMVRLGQPAVLGQLLAGILLGRSVLGSLFPAIHGLVFPIESTQSYLLEVVSWLGVIFLLMLTGMETDLALIRQQGRAALWTSLTGVVVPFGLGFGIGMIVPGSLLTSPQQRPILAAFLGTALSVSSVPVVGRILMDMRLLRRNLGQVILASALGHDVAGWIILALVAGLARTGTVDALSLGRTLTGITLFTAISLTIGRKGAYRFLRWSNDRLEGEHTLLTAVTVLVLISAATTQFIGVHAILGAFIAGVVLSGSPLVGPAVVRPIEAVTLGIFAPIFFAAAGLNVDLRALANPPILAVTLLVTGAACIGKIAGCYAGARWGGLGKWESLGVGIGANARGAMGLIIAILGLSLGIVTVQMFTIIIVMALLTTAMTPPLLHWALPHVVPGKEEQERLEREEREAASSLARMRRVLLPARGGAHAVMAARLLHALGQQYPMEVTGLHVTSGDASDAAAAALDAVERTIHGSRMTVVRRVIRSSQAVDAILREAARGYDFLAFGCSNDPAPSPDAVFGNLADRIAREAPCPVLVVRAPAQPEGWQPRRILVPTTGAAYALPAAEMAIALARSTGAHVTALHVMETKHEALFWFTDQRRRAEDLAREVVDKVVALGEPFGVQVEGIVRPSHHAAIEIVAVAEMLKVDLIIMSGSSRPTQQLFMGHTIAHVLSSAPCAVAVVQP